MLIMLKSLEMQIFALHDAMHDARDHFFLSPGLVRDFQFLIDIL